MAILEIKNLAISYGGIKAIRSLNLSVEEGMIVAIIGANGAGKSTLLRSIAGDQSYFGSILFENEQLPKESYKVVKKGISLVPEGRRIFPNLTVMENLQIGAYMRNDKERIIQELEEIFILFPRLKERLKQLGGSLSGGEQQMLAVSRALIANPKLLLLDEPSLGLAPIVIDELFNTIVKINKEKNITIIMVEQNAYVALEIADQAYVLASGDIVLEGTGQEILNQDKLVESFLGTNTTND